MFEWQPAGSDAARAQKTCSEIGKPGERDCVTVVIAGSDIGMDESSVQALKGSGGLADLSEHKAAVFGSRALICGKGAVEGDDAASGQALPQMIVGAAITEAEFDYWAFHRRNIGDDMVENVALRCDAGDETVQTAHGLAIFPAFHLFHPSAPNRPNSQAI